jgi:Lon-like protease
MSPRTATLLVSSVLIVLLTALTAFLPVPYVVLQPGPTTNTLGTTKGQPLIQIDGVRTYAATGHLDLTTVAVFGGPDDPVDLVTALRGWLDRTVAVVPEESVFPAGQSPREVEQETARQMVESQDHATSAALRQLGIDVDTKVLVAAVRKGTPADGRLRPGDVVVAVDGVPVRTDSALRGRIADREPGDPVDLTVLRDGDRETLRLHTVPYGGNSEHPIVGFTPRTKHEFPFSVKIRLRQVGGPSAGLMFALGIVEKLTPGDLTGGEYVAGTGAINDRGRVQPIGGIEQKVVAARGAGARTFLTPAGNCAAAVGARPDGLRLVRVERLADALEALDAIKTGRGEVPTCSG